MHSTPSPIIIGEGLYLGNMGTENCEISPKISLIIEIFLLNYLIIQSLLVLFILTFNYIIRLNL